jgi:hypothetical protein
MLIVRFAIVLSLLLAILTGIELLANAKTQMIVTCFLKMVYGRKMTMTILKR